MSVVRTRKYAELGEHGSRQPILRQHALDCVLNDEFRLVLTHIRKLAIALSTDEAGEKHILVLHLFFAGQHDLLSIDKHDVIAGINVRGVVGIVTTAKNIGDFNCETTKHLPLGIDKIPLGLHCLLFGEEGFHGKRGQ